jgi:hypothetical protein
MIQGSLWVYEVLLIIFICQKNPWEVDINISIYEWTYLSSRKENDLVKTI